MMDAAVLTITQHSGGVAVTAQYCTKRTHKITVLAFTNPTNPNCAAPNNTASNLLAGITKP
jgi:hypothetical protein